MTRIQITTRWRKIFGLKQHETFYLHMLRLAAHVASLICLAIILLFFTAEKLDHEDVSGNQLVGFLFFPVGVFVGLVLAWRKEYLGGIIAACSVAGFYVVYGWYLEHSMHEQGWFVLPFLVPASLFIAYGYLASSSQMVDNRLSPGSKIESIANRVEVR